MRSAVTSKRSTAALNTLLSAGRWCRRGLIISMDCGRQPRAGNSYGRIGQHAENVARARSRLGQGAFRVMVTDAYQRRCAVTGEKTLPVLEAAHIRPYALSGPNRVSNGLLLRSDLHTLFDLGYITVTPELRLLVSRRLREEWHNGLEYSDAKQSRNPLRPWSPRVAPG